ncbi:MAG: NADPH-dependent 7-cyano-7-deazaguanine reductase QueF [Odoribacteraceae bacterium]|nr:NADPH-dependent 7-cyano-7-deazaguanine reductase QueF [Odoribacteraceae bacterium]
MDRASYLLGRQVEYPASHDPDLLHAVARSGNRDALGIPAALFHGVDAWHAREAGFLTARGLPVTGVLKIVYPADSPFLVESKSLKLYLNSLNMTPLGETPGEGIARFARLVREELSRALQAPVETCFFAESPRDPLPFDFGDDYPSLEAQDEAPLATFSDYRETPSLLLDDTRAGGDFRACSHLLRSNCKITGQPDWGSIYIRLKAPLLPSPLSLLRYIVSLRAENHFHEEVCEMIYKRLWDAFSPSALAVTCLYTRRGGIDICPSRASAPELLPPLLSNPRMLSRKTFRQ